MTSPKSAMRRLALRATLALAAAVLPHPAFDAAAADGPAPLMQDLLHSQAPQDKPRTVIGRCGDYLSIDGSAKITRIAITAESAHQASVGGGPGYEGYEVWFAFTPDEPVADGATKEWIAREHQLRLANSWYPGPAFLAKYAIEEGATFAAILKVQNSGPCTPFVFDFPTVDNTDYFESGT